MKLSLVIPCYNEEKNILHIRKDKYKQIKKWRIHKWSNIKEQKALEELLEKHKKEKILIVGHSTALASLFSKWCEISYAGPYKYNDIDFFDGKWNYCETFRLYFDDTNKLISIKNIKWYLLKNCKKL